MNFRTRQRPAIAPRLKYRLVSRIKLSSLMALSEQQFFRYLGAIESSPLFIKLASSADPDRRVISCRRFPGTGFRLPFSELNEEVQGGGTDPVDVRSLMQRHQEAVALITSIGSERFEKWFLYNEGGPDPAVIGAACGLPGAGVDAIRRLVDELAVYAEFSRASPLRDEFRLRYCRVAAVEEDGAGGFLIKFYSPRFARGRYSIDAERLEHLKKAGFFSEEEARDLPFLLETLERINARKSTLCRILQRMVEVQGDYLKSGNERHLIAYPQRELSRDTGIGCCLVSRAIGGRSIVTPRGAEKPLKFFFPSAKRIRQYRIMDIIENEAGVLTDREIASLLRNRYGIEASRRSVCACREEMRIYSSCERRNNHGYHGH